MKKNSKTKSVKTKSRTTKATKSKTIVNKPKIDETKTIIKEKKPKNTIAIDNKIKVRKKRNKKLLLPSLIVVVVIIIILIILLCKPKKNELDNTEINIDIDKTTEKEDFKVDKNGIKLSEVNIKEQKKNAVLSIKITNTTDNDINKETLYKIVMYDENGKDINTINSYFSSLKAHESIVSSTLIKKEYAKAKSFKFIILDDQE